MRSNIRRYLWPLAAALLVVATACSDSESDVEVAAPADGTGEESAGDWVSHTLGTFAADREIVGAPIDDGVAVLTVEEPGDVRGFRLEPDGTIREASVDAGQAEFRMVTAITDGPSGLVATGNDLHPDFENFVLTSPDGLAGPSQRRPDSTCRWMSSTSSRPTTRTSPSGPCASPTTRLAVASCPPS